MSPPNDDDDNKEGGESLEMMFKNVDVPNWKNQISWRSIVRSTILSVVFTFIVMKLNLTTFVIPSLNVAAGLMGFAILK
ncbi:hypothetical protein LIER_41100 [Lithospermum erythrorhizon]|uniref:Uncharacterized protein n=1 Tax=Lithospermum erythrorhizon TaxID=34254 RepID=A0AAV3R862_LITER